MSATEVRPLTPYDRLALVALLERDTQSNLFLLATVRDLGLRPTGDFAWWGGLAHNELRAVCWIARSWPDPEPDRVAGLAVPWGDEDACAAIGGRLATASPPRMLIGARSPCDGLWRGMGSPAASLYYDQRLMVLHRPTAGPRLALRRALPAEWALVSEMSARMMLEDLGEDPRALDREGHELRVKDRIRRGGVLLGEEQGRVVFKLDLGSRTNEGVQVGGTWVPPEARGRGVATAGMRAAADQLLERHDWISLHLNEANLPAMSAYLSAGFQRAAPFRMAIRADDGNPAQAPA